MRQALDEAGRLAHRIYPPLLEAGGLRAALRSAAASVGVATRLDVAADAGHPPELAGTVYFCCLAALEHAGAGARAAISVANEEGALVFEIADDGAGSPGDASDEALDRMRDRVEALGGRLTVRSEPGGGTRVSGLLPLVR